MSDRELLKLAAKAAGIGPVLGYESRRNCLRIGDRNSYGLFRPLTDDGDALRLAVKLRLVCGMVSPNCWAELPGEYPSYEPCEPDPYAATRRAIVRAAAEIGRSMG